MMNKLRVLEAFGGIGAVHSALEKMNVNYEVVEMIEFDKYAVKSYNAIHNTDFSVQDILSWDKDLRVDYAHFSTPCQAFSNAGKRLGAEDERGAPLWQATLDVIKKTQPTIITLENVKGLLSAKHSELLNWYIDELTKLGYKTKYKVLNSKYFGIPQNRERVFIVSRNDGRPIVFPQNNTVETVLKDILVYDERVQWDSIDLDKVKWECLDEKGDWVHSDSTTRKVGVVKEPLKTMNIPLSKNYTQNLMSSPEGQSTTLTTFPKFIYIPNAMSQYNNNIIEINVEKLLNQKTGEINRVGGLKKNKWPNFGDSKLINVGTGDRNDFMGEDGVNVCLTVRSSDEQKVMSLKDLEDIDYQNNKSFMGDSGISGTLRAQSYSMFQNKVMTLAPLPFRSDQHFMGEEGLTGSLVASNTDFKAKVMRVSDLLSRIQYRKLIPLETWRLMGFSDEQFERATLVNSNSQLTKQAGNSIVVPVMQELLQGLFDA